YRVSIAFQSSVGAAAAPNDAVATAASAAHRTVHLVISSASSRPPASTLRERRRTVDRRRLTRGLNLAHAARRSYNSAANGQTARAIRRLRVGPAGGRAVEVGRARPRARAPAARARSAD